MNHCIAMSVAFEKKTLKSRKSHSKASHKKWGYCKHPKKQLGFVHFYDKLRVNLSGDKVSSAIEISTNHQSDTLPIFQNVPFRSEKTEIWQKT